MRPARPLLLVAVTVGALLAVLFIRRYDADREFRRLLAEGELALSSERPHAAVTAFTAAVALRPAAMVGHYRRGEALAAVGRVDEALANLREARRLAPGAREPIEALGRLADRAGKPAEAAVWYRDAVDRLPVADPRLLYALAAAHFRSGSPALAIDPLKRALLRDPSMAEAYYLLGLASRDAGQPNEAAAAFDQAIRLSPTFLPARREVAELWHEQSRVTEEIVARRGLAALEPTADAYIDLGLAHARAGHVEEATAALAQAEGIDRTNARLALAVGRAHLIEAERTREPAVAKRALMALEKALGSTARRSEGLALYGRALYLSDDTASSVRILNDAVRTSPVDPEAYEFLADAAERAGQPMVARDALMALTALEGDTAHTDLRRKRARRIGALSLAAGDAAVAVDFLTTAVRDGYVEVATLGLLARSLWQVGRVDDARRTLGEAMALDGRNAELRRLARTIR